MRASGRRRRRASPEQLASAEGWLRRLGRPVTAEAAEQLAPHVKVEGTPELAEVQAFARLVRRGQVPTAASLRDEMAAQPAREDRLRRQQEQVRAALDDLDTFGEVVAAEVVRHRAQEGRSPTWRELSRTVGCPLEVLEKVLPRLRLTGWITYDRQPGSLQPGPAFEAATADAST